MKVSVLQGTNVRLSLLVIKFMFQNRKEVTTHISVIFYRSVSRQ
jgi:hypothetical protein